MHSSSEMHDVTLPISVFVEGSGYTSTRLWPSHSTSAWELILFF